MPFDPRQLRHISLKWKLLIPFLFLPLVLTVLLVSWEIRSEHQILASQEESRMRDNFRHLQYRLKMKLDVSGAMALLVASNPAAQKALAEKDRDTLIRLYHQEYEKLRLLAGIKQFHFHTIPTRSLLRLNSLDQYGDDLSYRQTILKACQTGQVVTGLEVGLTGFGLRGVAPVFHEGRLVGTVEIGSSLEQPFLDQFKEDFRADLTLYVPAVDLPRGFNILATTAGSRTFLAPEAYRQVLDTNKTIFLTMEAGGDRLAVLAGPVFDIKGQAVAVVEILLDRTETLNMIDRHSTTLLTFGLIVLVLALIFVWRISVLFLAPIGALMEQAEKITAGTQVRQIEVTVHDEFGVLAQTLNRMLAKLDAAQARLQNQAHELEMRVEQRTMELVLSEEKFRTMVEHIPIVVYRVEPGLIRSFVSPYIEKLTGWPPEELVGGPAAWSGIIHPRDRQRVVDTIKKALEEGTVLEAEYCLQDRQGQPIEVLDHAQPVRHESGQVIHLEGYLLDIRERRHLHEQAVQAEELRTLTEISARLAHELRNPLSVVGVSARRILKHTADTDRIKPYAAIMIEEVARLEQILNMTQGFIKPVKLQVMEIDTRAFFTGLIHGATPFFTAKSITVQTELPGELPRMSLDPDLMGRALTNLLRNAAFQIPTRGTLAFQVLANHKTIQIKLVYPAGYLPDDQLRHFFYPFTTEEADSKLVELPLVPVIVHKHNGVINVGREGEDLVAVAIVLPIGGSDDSELINR